MKNEIKQFVRYNLNKIPHLFISIFQNLHMNSLYTAPYFNVIFILI